MIRSAIAGVARAILLPISARVARDGLFEQPGERPPTAPLPVSTPSSQKPAAEASSGPGPGTPLPVAGRRASPPAGTGPVGGGRPVDGCVPVDLAGLRAALTPTGRPLVVNHWATWCDPCVEELPRLVRAAAGLGGTADVLGVSWDLFGRGGVPAKVATKVAAFAASSGVGFSSVLYTGEPAELFAACGLDVETVPQTLVLDPAGRVVWHNKGVLTDDDVFPLIAAVRAAAGGAS